MSEGATVAQGGETLITDNIALVGHIVRETMGRVPSHVCRDDLTSAGLIALVQAAASYDVSRGVPFVNYASTRIRGALLDELRSTDWASRSVRRRAREVDATAAQLANVLHRSPTNAEIASALGVTVEEVDHNASDIARARLVSLDGATHDVLDELLPSHQPGPEEALQHREQLAYLREAIAELPDRLRVVVEQYFLAERPMAEIAAELGVTESRVSQIRAEALVLLRDVMRRELEPGLTTEGAPAVRSGGCVERRRQAYFDAVAARHAVGVRPRAAAVPVPAPA